MVNLGIIVLKVDTISNSNKENLKEKVVVIVHLKDKNFNCINSGKEKD